MISDHPLQFRRMCDRQLLIFLFIIYFASRGQCFKNGYSVETCNSLKPNQEVGEPNVTADTEVSPFEIEARPKYRINGKLEIILKGKNIEGFQLQVREENADRNIHPSRVGEFVEWPETAQPLECDDGKKTAITHKSLERKDNLKFIWQAPDEDKGVLRIYDAYVSQDGAYMADVCDVKLDVADLPVSVKDCGKHKSCVRYSETGCNGNTCSYLLTYQNHTNDLEFTLSSLSEVANTYSAVGFRENKDEKLHLIACIRETGENPGVSVRHYISEAEEEPLVEKTGNIQEIKVDKEGNNTWCEFTMPIKDSGVGALDFNKNLYWIYAWGKINETTNIPVRGKTWYQSDHNVNIKEYIDNQNNDSSSMLLSCYILVSLSSLLSFVSQL